MSYDLMAFDPAAVPHTRDAFLAWDQGRQGDAEDQPRFQFGMSPYRLCLRCREIVSKTVTCRDITSPKTSGISHVYADDGACRKLQSFCLWPMALNTAEYLAGQSLVTA